MAEPLFQTSLEGPDSHPASLPQRVAGALSLMVCLIVARALREDLSLLLSLSSARPRPAAVAQGLAHEDARVVTKAIQALEAQPRGRAGTLLAQSPLGEGLPVDRLILPLLCRHKDRPALLALAGWIFRITIATF